MTPERLELTPALWQTTLGVLTSYRLRRVEGGCLWYGQRDAQTARAVLVGIPRQINRARNFEIPADALAELNTLVTRVRNDLVVVAQVHTHPGAETRHSLWDDAMMVSRKVFSLVLPRYSMLPCNIDTVGLHVHDGTKWMYLTREEAKGRLVVVEYAKALDEALLDETLIVDTR